MRAPKHKPRLRKWTLRKHDPLLLASLWETALHSEDFADLEWVCYIAEADQADQSVDLPALHSKLDRLRGSRREPNRKSQ